MDLQDGRRFVCQFGRRHFGALQPERLGSDRLALLLQMQGREASSLAPLLNLRLLCHADGPPLSLGGQLRWHWKSQVLLELFAALDDRMFDCCSDDGLSRGNCRVAQILMGNELYGGNYAFRSPYFLSRRSLWFTHVAVVE